MNTSTPHPLPAPHALPGWAALVLAAASLALAGPASAQDGTAWLAGTWQLAQDRKNPGFTDDFMDFDAQGTVVLRDSKKTYAHCRYQPGSGTLLLTCIAGGKERPMTVRVAPDRASLTNSVGDVYRKSRK